jgi:hypothetical protein
MPHTLDLLIWNGAVKWEPPVSSEPPRFTGGFAMALVVWSRVTGLHATVNACSNSSGVSMPSALWRLVRLWNSSR